VLNGARLRPLAFGSEHQVSRRGVRDSFSDSVLALRHSGGLSQLGHPGTLAASVRTEPDGRSRRRLSLGIAWSAKPVLGSSPCFDHSREGAAYRRLILLPANGARLC